MRGGVAWWLALARPPPLPASLARPPLLAAPLSHPSLRTLASLPSFRPSTPPRARPTATSSRSIDADTIFALSSGAGRAGVSVVRISGPHARNALLTLAPGASAALPAPRRAVVRKLRSAGGELIDEVLALWFPAPRSFTGEDVVELHTHGGRAVVSATLDALGALPGLRLAEAGEFTRQAFSNGRMELTQVEGLADLINADTDAQRRQALAQMGGAQREQYDGWRQALLGSLAHTEALIDFGEDAEDVTAEALRGAVEKMRALRGEIARRLADGGRGEVVREGVRVAILGPPNAGKSSLLNLLAQRPAAIVSPRAGTTRDVVQVTLELGGLPLLLSDTAGLREDSDDPIEQQGMSRAVGPPPCLCPLPPALLPFPLPRDQLPPHPLMTAGGMSARPPLAAVQAAEARRANVQLWVFDAREPPATAADLTAAPHAHSGAAELPFGYAAPPDEPAGPDAADQERLLVLNKVDLLPPSHGGERGGQVLGMPAERQHYVSCATGEGVQPFLDALAALVQQRYGASPHEAVLVTRARHREHLRACVEALDEFVALASLGECAPLDLAAEELRTAANEIGRITGRIGVEELLDVIFRDFCIGK